MYGTTTGSSSLLVRIVCILRTNEWDDVLVLSSRVVATTIHPLVFVDESHE